VQSSISFSVFSLLGVSLFSFYLSLFFPFFSLSLSYFEVFSSTTILICVRDGVGGGEIARVCRPPARATVWFTRQTRFLVTFMPGEPGGHRTGTAKTETRNRDTDSIRSARKNERKKTYPGRTHAPTPMTVMHLLIFIEHHPPSNQELVQYSTRVPVPDLGKSGVSKEVPVQVKKYPVQSPKVPEQKSSSKVSTVSTSKS